MTNTDTADVESTVQQIAALARAVDRLGGDTCAGLVALGVQPEHRVAIASGTRYEWVLADLAIMRAGAATTTVYPSAIPDDVAFILADSMVITFLVLSQVHAPASMTENPLALTKPGQSLAFDVQRDKAYADGLDPTDGVPVIASPTGSR